MPSTSQTTPSSEALEGKIHRVIDRRARSGKQDSSVAASQWPLVTRTAYNQLVRTGQVPDELANLRMRRLCEARRALGQAMLAIDNSMHDHRPGQVGLLPGVVDEYAKVWQELRRLRGVVEKGVLGFPLTMRD